METVPPGCLLHGEMKGCSKAGYGESKKGVCELSLEREHKLRVRVRGLGCLAYRVKDLSEPVGFAETRSTQAQSLPMM